MAIRYLHYSKLREIHQVTASHSFSICLYHCKDCEHVFSIKTKNQNDCSINRFDLRHSRRPTCELCGSVDVKRMFEKTVTIPLPQKQDELSI